MNYCEQDARWGQDAGGGSMARAGLPAWAALGRRRAIPSHKAQAYKGTWQSRLGEAKSFANRRSYPLGTLNTQEACTLQEGASVTCCVTSVKFHFLSGPWFSHPNTQAVRTDGFSGSFLLQHSTSEASFYSHIDGPGSWCWAGQFLPTSPWHSRPQHQTPWGPRIKSW